MKGYQLPLQPSGLKPYVPGAHLSHLLPTTFGLHVQPPPYSEHNLLTDPVTSHRQATTRILEPKFQFNLNTYNALL